MNCPDSNKLTAFIEQKLPDEHRSKITVHLADCPTCYEMVVELARFSGSQGFADHTALALAQIAQSTMMAPIGKTPVVGDDQVPGATALDKRFESADAVDSKLTVAVGTMVDHFRIMRRLGHGGMGTVYLARDTKLGRKVALKLVNPDVLGSHDAIERFLFEARTTAKFNHPNIVTVYAVGQLSGTPYVALEYLEGQDLRQRVREERPSVNEALRIILAVTEAVQEAHRHGILHRDLKPANVLLPKDGRIRVVDFGLAHHTGDRDRRSSTVHSIHSVPNIDGLLLETDGKTIRGTPAYMAPEQWKGEGCSSATDIWAIGLLLYEMCTGTLPYLSGHIIPNNSTSPIQSLIDGVCSDDPVPPIRKNPEVTKPVAAIIAQCLEKDPQRRPTPTLLIESLQEILFEGRRSFSDEESPFRGLLPFAERHADVFFGRNREVSALVERLRHEPTIVIVGVSGAGKSSLVQAGLVPRLRQQGDWHILRIRPGQASTQRLARRLIALREESHPSLTSTGSDPRLSQQSALKTSNLGQLHQTLCEQPGELGNQLRLLTEEGGFKVLLIADQLEELFTLNNDPDDRRHFLRAICNAADDIADGVRIVLTIRSDFLPQLAEEGAEVRRILEHVMVLHTPDEAARIEILTAPLEAVGYRYDDPDLPSEMAREVDTESSLPLLQFAARRLWDKRDRINSTLCRKEYENMGGVTGALTQHADSLFETLSPEATLTARTLLLRLITPDRTRRVMPQAQLLEQLGQDAPTILDRLIKGRLLTVGGMSGQTTADAHIELAHEALISHWPRLAEWIEESHDERLFNEQLQQAAELWAERGRHIDNLWQGDALHDGERHLKRSSSKPAVLVQEFLEASQQHANRRVRRVRRSIALALMAISLVAVVLGFQKQQLREKNVEAETHRRQAEQRAIETLIESAQGAYARGVPLEARAKLRLAFEATEKPSVAARVLWQQLLLEPAIWVQRVSGLPYKIATTKNSDLIAVASQKKLVYLLDKTTGSSRILPGHSDQVLNVAMSPDGALLASVSKNGELILWRLPDGVQQAKVAPNALRLSQVFFEPSGKWLATGGVDRKISFYHPTDLRLLRTLDMQAAISASALSPNGRLLAIADESHNLQVWNLDNNKLVHRDALGAHFRRKLMFRPDGKQLALSSNELRIWDSTTWRSHRLGAPNIHSTLSYGPRGRYLYASVLGRRLGGQSRLEVWDVTKQQRVHISIKNTGKLWDLLYNDERLGLISSSQNRLVQRSMPPRMVKQTAHQQAILRLKFGPKGKRLYSTSNDGTIRTWNVKTGEQEAIYKVPGASPWGIDLSPDGQQLAIGTSGGDIDLWNNETKAKLATIDGNTVRIVGIAYTPDGNSLAVGAGESRIDIREVPSGKLKHELPSRHPLSDKITFSADGKLLLNGTQMGGIELWDFERRVLLREYKGHRSRPGECYGASLSPDARYVVSGGKDSILRIWDAKTASSLHNIKMPGRSHGTAFHPTLPLIGNATSDNNAYFVSLNGHITMTLRGHRAEVNDIDFSPDGSYAATGSDDHTVRIWDSKTGRPYWRAPLFISSPPQLLTHRGLQTIDTNNQLGPATQALSLWQQTIFERAKIARALPNSNRICVQLHGDGAGDHMQLWATPSGKVLADLTADAIHDLKPIGNGCLGLTDTQAIIISEGNEQLPLATSGRPTAIGTGDSNILVASGEEVLVFNQAGVLQKRHGTRPDIRALHMVTQNDDGSSTFVAGFENGILRRHTIKTAGTADPPLDFQQTSSGTALTLMSGPMGTIIAGFSDGSVGLWDLDSGRRLLGLSLHGVPTHLSILKQQLIAVSDLGDFQVLKLNALYADRCELLKEVWEEVPVVWERGQAITRKPPKGHPCASR